MKKLNISAIESASILSSDEKKNIVGGLTISFTCKTCIAPDRRIFECCEISCLKFCKGEIPTD